MVKVSMLRYEGVCVTEPFCL
uniref:Uncharacterized protein n=1 Tax=Arundo donax TaxID=35708 RepID=A0A0A9HIE7_ARUDO